MIDTLKTRLVRKRRPSEPEIEREELYVLVGGNLKGFRALLPVSELVAHLDPRARRLPRKGYSRLQATSVAFATTGLLVGSIMGAVNISAGVTGLLASAAIGLFSGVFGGFVVFALFQDLRFIPKVSGAPYWVARSVTDADGIRTIEGVLHQQNDVWTWFDDSESALVDEEYERVKAGSRNGASNGNGAGTITKEAIKEQLRNGSKPRTNIYDSGFMYVRSQMKDEEIILRGGISPWQKMAFVGLMVGAIAIGVIAIMFVVVVTGEGA